MKPIHEVWASIDSCGEHWGWEDIEKLDPRIKIPTDPSTHRYIYTADQLRQAKVEALRDAREKFTDEPTRYALLCMAAEIEKGEQL